MLWPEGEAAAAAGAAAAGAAATAEAAATATAEATPTTTLPPPAPLRADAAPPPDLSYLAGKLAIVGVGARGAAAARALARDFPAISSSNSSSTSSSSAPRLWALDSDAAALAAPGPGDAEGNDLPLATPVLLTATTTTAGSSSAAAVPRLSPAAAAALVAAVAGSDAGGRGNASAGDGGVAVVLGASCGTPGPQALLDTARAFASAGALTACAVAAPFGFEGASATRAAASAIRALGSTAAHVAAVVDQAVLAAPPSEPGAPSVTMAEAAAIADAALAQCGRTLLASLAAPDVLGVASNGAASWHARDAAAAPGASPSRRGPSAASLSLKNARRALLPPLAAALAPPGRSALGRGSAAVEAGRGSGNSDGEVSSLVAALAADAVRAAAESPFLLDAAANSSSSSANGPSSLIGVVFLPLDQLSRAESRAAVQAAASAAAEAFSSGGGGGVGCAAFVYAPLLESDESESGNASELRVEVSLLATYPEAAAPAGSEGAKTASSPRSALPEGVAAAIQGAAAAAAKKEKEKEKVVAAPAPATAAPPPPPPPPPPAPPAPIETPFTSSPRDTARNPNAVARSLDLPPAAAAWREARRAPVAPRVRYLPVGPDGSGAFSSLAGLSDDDNDEEDEDGARLDEDDWESEEEEDESGGRRRRGGVLGALASLASLRRSKGKSSSSSSSSSSSAAASAASVAKTRDRVAGMLERERDFGP